MKMAKDLKLIKSQGEDVTTSEETCAYQFTRREEWVSIKGFSSALRKHSTYCLGNFLPKTLQNTGALTRYKILLAFSPNVISCATQYPIQTE